MFALLRICRKHLNKDKTGKQERNSDRGAPQRSYHSFAFEPGSQQAEREKSGKRTQENQQCIRGHKFLYNSWLPRESTALPLHHIYFVEIDGLFPAEERDNDRKTDRRFRCGHRHHKKNKNLSG